MLEDGHGDRAPCASGYRCKEPQSGPICALALKERDEPAAKKALARPPCAQLEWTRNTLRLADCYALQTRQANRNSGTFYRPRLKALVPQNQGPIG